MNCSITHLVHIDPHGYNQDDNCSYAKRWWRRRMIFDIRLCRSSRIWRTAITLGRCGIVHCLLLSNSGTQACESSCEEEGTVCHGVQRPSSSQGCQCPGHNVTFASVIRDASDDMLSGDSDVESRIWVKVSSTFHYLLMLSFLVRILEDNYTSSMRVTRLCFLKCRNPRVT